jgi:hypothetical protein
MKLRVSPDNEFALWMLLLSLLGFAALWVVVR